MPSPFPGMDPYLEGALWTKVHFSLSAEIVRQLAPKLRPRYLVLPAERFAMETPESVLCPAFSVRAHVDGEDFVRREPGLRAHQLRLAQGVEITHEHRFGIGIHGHHLSPVTTRQEYLCPYGQLGKIHRFLLTRCSDLQIGAWS